MALTAPLGSEKQPWGALGCLPQVELELQHLPKTDPCALGQAEHDRLLEPLGERALV